MDVPQDIQHIIERMDQGVQISSEELHYVTTWYTQQVQKLDDDIKVSKIKKEIENL
jgi:hypothetical protein